MKERRKEGNQGKKEGRKYRNQGRKEGRRRDGGTPRKEHRKGGTKEGRRERTAQVHVDFREKQFGLFRRLFGVP